MHGIRADEDQRVAFLEIRIGERRRVEAERLFVGDVRGRHALPRIGVDVQHAHAELRERAEQRHLLHHDLPRARETTIADGPCSLLNALKFSVNAPVRAPRKPARVRPVAASRSSGVVARSVAASGVSASQPFGHAMPRLTGYSGSAGEIDRFAGGIEMNLQRATGAAEAAHRGGRRGGLETRRQMTQAKLARVAAPVSAVIGPCRGAQQFVRSSCAS